MLLRPLTNFEIQKYYKNVAKFNGVYSRNNVLINRNSLDGFICECK